MLDTAQHAAYAAGFDLRPKLDITDADEAQPAIAGTPNALRGHLPDW
jgi:hypothetical protein